eukprot:m.261031 g.261031  ORF g.261031 m.261031 type:complete len:415 (+) comp41143_c0_seq1:196-1440(+)
MSSKLQAQIDRTSCEFIKDRLYFCVLSEKPQNTSERTFLYVDHELHYEPFHRDFGPLNMAMLYRYCTRLSLMLKSRQHEGKAIYHWTSANPNASAQRTNAAYLIAAYAVVILGRSPQESYAPLKKIESMLATFRDASYSNTCEFRLSVADCMLGLSQGMVMQWLDLPGFNIAEYEHYERVEYGDLNWVLPGKFIAFAGPHNEHKWDNGYPLLAPENYFDYFNKGNVTDIIRLNNPLYDRKRFIDAGFVHHDLFFVDGSIPPTNIRKRFLDIAEQAKGGIAIHCKAGLGRTGTLIACYMMKHYMLTATECISWLRVNRPGSVLGPQQFYLQNVQMEMWAEGLKIGSKRVDYDTLMKGESADANSINNGLSNISLKDASKMKYDAPETTAPKGVEQGDYLNARKLEAQKLRVKEQK